MAIYRTVSLNYWTDTKIADEFTPEDKYFMLYLLTNPHTNLLGCYEISHKYIIQETGYNKDTIDKLLEHMEHDYEVIEYDPTTKEIFINNWYKYNWTKSEKLKKNLVSNFNTIKSEKFKKKMYELFIMFDVDVSNIGYAYPMDTTVTGTVTDTVTVTDTDIKSEIKEIVYSDNPTKSSEMILKDGSKYLVDANFIAKAKDTYKAVDVDIELKKMELWLLANPGKRKTRSGMNKFILNWLSRNNEKQITYQNENNASKAKKESIQPSYTAYIDEDHEHVSEPFDLKKWYESQSEDNDD